MIIRLLYNKYICASKLNITYKSTLIKEDVEAGISSESIQEKLKRLKWSLWHGNVFKALSKIEDLIDDAYVLASDDYDLEPNIEAEKLCSHLEEFETYISNNGSYIPNYGDRHHNGERISSSFVESTVNQVISKRFVKKQQMRWTRLWCPSSNPGASASFKWRVGQ